MVYGDPEQMCTRCYAIERGCGSETLLCKFEIGSYVQHPHLCGDCRERAMKLVSKWIQDGSPCCSHGSRGHQVDDLYEPTPTQPPENVEG